MTKQFIDGLFTDEYTFPDGGIKTTITITDKMIEFYQANKKPNSKGNNQMKIDLKHSKAGKLYAELNTYVKPQPAEVKIDDDFDSEIPF